MKFAEKDKALYLRIEQQLGYRTIAKQLRVSKSTLSRWLRDVPLSEERIKELRKNAWSRGEASREIFRRTMRRKREMNEQKIYEIQLKKFKKLSDQSLFVAGLMLYLAEGDKKNYASIGFANTDPEIISFFIWWLNKFLKIPKYKLKLELHLYESMDLRQEEKFWEKRLKINRDQFYKNQVRPLRKSSFSYRESFRHGTCKVYFYSVQSKSELMLSIKAFLATYDRVR